MTQRIAMCLTALTLLTLQVMPAGCVHAAPVPDAPTQQQLTPPMPTPGPETPAQVPGLPEGLYKPKGQHHFVVELTLRGEVNDSAAVGVQSVVDAVNASLNDPSQDPVEAVVFVLDTPGGSMVSGTLIAESLQSLAVPLVCVVDAHAYSMGAFLLENVCPVRLATNRASIMFHEPHFSGDVTLTNPRRGDFQSIEESLRVETEAWLKRAAERMGLTLPELAKKLHNNEWWMTAQEALEAKVVDGVVNSIGRDIERPLERNLQLPETVTKVPLSQP